MSQKKLKVKLVHSTAGRDKRQEEIIRGLGLRKLYGERELIDTPCVRGMIAKVPHLVRVVEENIVLKKAKSPGPKTKDLKKEEVGKDESE